MSDRVLLISSLERAGLTEDVAMDYATSNGCVLDILLVLSSHLFHYGKNDVVVPGNARCQFLFHIRLDLLRQAWELEKVLKEKAAELGLQIRISMAELDDCEDAMIREASRGYKLIFVPKEKKKRFPLFGNATWEKTLQKRGFENVVPC